MNLKKYLVSVRFPEIYCLVGFRFSSSLDKSVVASSKFGGNGI